MRIPRKLKKKLRKQEFQHLLNNAEEILTDFLRKTMFIDFRNWKP